MHRLVLALDDPAVNVNVVRVKVVRDIALNTGPRLESVKLSFGLRHVAVEEVEVTEGGVEALAGIRVSRVVTLVAGSSAECRYFTLNSLLNPACHVVLRGELDKLKVVNEVLRSWLGDHDVMTKSQSELGDRVVGRVRSEDCLLATKTLGHVLTDDGAALPELFKSTNISLGVTNVALGESVEAVGQWRLYNRVALRSVKAVDLFNVLLQVVANVGELVVSLKYGCDAIRRLTLPPLVPTMLSSPTLPRRRRSKLTRPTTPTFLSDLVPPEPVHPVVYCKC